MDLMTRKGSSAFLLGRGTFDGLDMSGQGSVHLPRGVIDSPGVLLADNGVFKRRKCFGFSVGHEPGKKIHARHFHRSRNVR